MTDCTKYYLCVHGTLWERPCHETLVFDIYRSCCTSPVGVDCNHRCPTTGPPTTTGTYGTKTTVHGATTVTYLGGTSPTTTNSNTLWSSDLTVARTFTNDVTKTTEGAPDTTISEVYPNTEMTTGSSVTVMQSNPTESTKEGFTDQSPTVAGSMNATALTSETYDVVGRTQFL